MARLKTKQISDFSSAVQTLIDNDSDQNAALIDAVEASVDSLEVYTGQVSSDLANEATARGNADTILEASIDSLEVATGGDTTAISNSIDSLETLTTGIQSDIDQNELDADASIDSLETYTGQVSSDLANEATARGNADTIHDASIDSLETQVGDIEQGDVYSDASIDSLETATAANATSISDMLAGSSIDLDTFAEIVDFVGSVDTVNDGIVSNLTANTGASIDSLEVQVTGLTGGSGASIDSLETLTTGIQSDVDQNELDADASIDSLETLAGTIQSDVDQNELDADASIDSLETALGVVQSDVDQNELDADASIDSLETALSGAIADDDASIDSLEDMVSYNEQGATVNSTTSFAIPVQVAFGSGDDLLVFINGHNIHRSGTIEGSTEGYQTVDGTNFNLISIGYDIDAEDHVMVLGHRA